MSDATSFSLGKIRQRGAISQTLLLAPTKDCVTDRHPKPSATKSDRSGQIKRLLIILVAFMCVLFVSESVGTPDLFLRSKKNPRRHEFLLPHHLSPGDMSPLLWRSDRKQADQFARLVGLPPKLTVELQEYCKQTGLLDAFWSPAQGQADTMSSEILDINGAGRWAVTSPGKDSNWENSNLRWFDAIDEETFEQTLGVLKRGEFDKVLDAVGSEFSSEGLMIAGVGFIVTSYSSGGEMHSDDPGVGDGFFDLLFPLILPENEKAELFIGDDENNSRLAPLTFSRNVGILMSGDTAHKTGNCDYRRQGGLRVAVSVYIADLNATNVDLIGSDDTALFPVPGNTEWLFAQKGRSWGGGNSLKNDKGRKPYTARDSNTQECRALAKAGMCDKDPWQVRPKCQKSCNIFIDDEQYYSEIIEAGIDMRVSI